MVVERFSRIRERDNVDKYVEAVGVDDRFLFFTVFGLIVLVVAAVVFGMFVHRANRNARAFGAVGMEVAISQRQEVRGARSTAPSVAGPTTQPIGG